MSWTVRLHCRGASERRQPQASDALCNRLRASSAVVPSLWHLEIANILVLAEKKGRVGPEKVTEFILLVTSLSIEVDDQTHSKALSDVMHLARAQGLTSYDAAYLELLAMRRGLPLGQPRQRPLQGGTKIGRGLTRCVISPPRKIIHTLG